MKLPVINCVHWRDCGIPGRGICLVNAVDGHPSHKFCNEHCQKREARPEGFVEPKQKVIIDFCMAPGDTVMLTGVILNLHLSHPGRFVTDVKCCGRETFFAGNPHLSHIADDAGVMIAHLPLFGEAPDRKPVHVVEQLCDSLGAILGVSIPCAQVRGDLYLTGQEKNWTPPVPKYIVVNAGGKRDSTCKWPDPVKMQQVVTAMPDVTFIQVGELCTDGFHVHPRLIGSNVIDMLGKTTWRETIRLIHHSAGLLSPESATMHIAGALGKRAVIVAGGRIGPSWAAYKDHIYLSAVGTLDCCRDRGCWKSRTVRLVDEKFEDEKLCVMPIIYPDRAVPKCIDDTSAEKIVASIREILMPPRPAAKSEPPSPVPRDQWPLWASEVARWRGGDDIGVGDTFHVIAVTTGAALAVAALSKLGLPCNCAERRQEWNTRYPY